MGRATLHPGAERSQGSISLDMTIMPFARIVCRSRNDRRCRSSSRARSAPARRHVTASPRRHRLGRRYPMDHLNAYRASEFENVAHVRRNARCGQPEHYIDARKDAYCARAALQGLRGELKWAGLNGSDAVQRKDRGERSCGVLWPIHSGPPSDQGFHLDLSPRSFASMYGRSWNVERRGAVAIVTGQCFGRHLLRPCQITDRSQRRGHPEDGVMRC